MKFLFWLKTLWERLSWNYVNISVQKACLKTLHDKQDCSFCRAINNLQYVSFSHLFYYRCSEALMQPHEFL